MVLILKFNRLKYILISATIAVIFSFYDLRAENDDFANLAKNILNENYQEALSSLGTQNSSLTKDIINDLINIEQSVLNGFKQHINKNIQLMFNDKKTTAFVKKIENNKITVLFKIDKMTIGRKIKVSDLTTKEKIKFFLGKTSESKGIYKGIIALKLKKNNSAKLAFKDAGILSKYLIIELDNEITRIETAKLAKKKAKLAKLAEEKQKAKEIEQANLSVKYTPQIKSDFKSFTLNMDFVFVKEGTFTMGYNDKDLESLKRNPYVAKTHNYTPHQVTLTKPYWIGRYEVTQKEWKELMGDSLISKLKFGVADLKPIYYVSWDDAVKFCEKLTEKELKLGYLPKCYEYRLPTEAEWEFAAKGGCKNQGKYFRYSGSDDARDVCWGSRNSDNKAYNVGTKQPNKLGIYDMSGNVAEWTLDMCRNSEENKAGKFPITDTYIDEITDPLSKIGSSYIHRGGGFLGMLSGYGKITSRRYYQKTSYDFGFRVCLGRQFLEEDYPLDSEQVSEEDDSVNKENEESLSKMSSQSQSVARNTIPQLRKGFKVYDFGMDFVFIKKGKFRMGTPDRNGIKATKNNKFHSVTLTKPYWLGRYEVTQQEWKDLMGTDINEEFELKMSVYSKFDKEKQAKIRSEIKLRGVSDRQPMYYVDWNDAMNFCKKLTEREKQAGRLPNGYEYRLPTEAEWEFVAKGCSDSKEYFKYSGSDNSKEVGWSYVNGEYTTHAVGLKEPNELGLYDMTGNVEEWVLDFVANTEKERRANKGLMTNTYKNRIKDPFSKKGSSRMCRGGSWGKLDIRSVVHIRHYTILNSKDDDIGFRVCLGKKLLK